MDLSSLYWKPKLHQCPYGQRYFVSFTKQKLVKSILSAIKAGLQIYCETLCSIRGAG